MLNENPINRAATLIPAGSTVTLRNGAEARVDGLPVEWQATGGQGSALFPTSIGDDWRIRRVWIDLDTREETDHE